MGNFRVTGFSRHVQKCNCPDCSKTHLTDMPVEHTLYARTRATVEETYRNSDKYPFTYHNIVIEEIEEEKDEKETLEMVL